MAYFEIHDEDRIYRMHFREQANYSEDITAGDQTALGWLRRFKADFQRWTRLFGSIVVKSFLTGAGASTSSLAAQSEATGGLCKAPVGEVQYTPMLLLIATSTGSPTSLQHLLLLLLWRRAGLIASHGTSGRDLRQA